MELFFISEMDSDAALVCFRGHEARHIANVLRHRTGDRVRATDGCGAEVELEISEVGPSRVIGRVLSTCERPREPHCRVTLVQGVLKGDGMVPVVEAATQLGVARIVPLVLARTVGRLSDVKLDRLRRVAVEAMKCSTRTVLPEVTEPMTLAEVLPMVPDVDVAVVAYEGEQKSGLPDLMSRRPGSVLVFVGPEGGIESEEVDDLRQAGAHTFSMGPRRLRAVTAGVVASAMVLQQVGDLGPSPGRVH